MKNIEKVYIKTVKFALFFAFAVIVYLYSSRYLNSLIILPVTEEILFVGAVLFLYCGLFSVIYCVKIIVFTIYKKDKYNKEEKSRDVKLVIGSIIAILIILTLFYINRGTVIGEQPLAKPVIYLYPESIAEVNVKLNNYNNLTHTYPKYIDGWDVIANPNGNIIDKNTGRNLYCLYWEGKDDSRIDESEGFVIQGKDVANFLEEKLLVLGLNEREANEFIIYWLPKMENNKYNYIRFRTDEEINNYMRLDISPKPDSLIRVVMDFKPLDKYKTVKEQELITPARTGFVAVEWGGRELK
jgi:hypothetical protein